MTRACLIRPGNGYMHIARPTGRGYETACCVTIRSPRMRAWTGHEADQVWRANTRYWCADCATLYRRGWGIIRRITGW